MADISFRNIQLYRTSPLLSGNMQWDLVLSPFTPSMMIVDSFHISPISDLIPYTYRKDEYLLATTHQHNIKTFYERTKSNFFSSVAPADLLSDWPIERAGLKNWDDTYWAGAKRIDRSRYDRTVSVLVPLWVEQASGFRFTITVSKGRDARSKTVEIRRSRDPQSFHDELGNYIYNYLVHVGIAPEQGGNNKCISVNFKDGQARITGLDVSTGILETKSIDQLARNLLYRERPLLENNTRICDVYKTSNIITPQLMNFNLLFNISDFFGDEPGDYKISVTTSAIGSGDEIEIMDLYTNHHFIPRPEFIPQDKKDRDRFVLQDTNALDYLKDYTITDIIHSNKIVQPVCHWVYQDNRSHLFNVYDGFGNFSRGEDGKKVFSPHVYDNASPSTAPISQRSWWTDKVFHTKEEISAAIASPADHLQALSGFVGSNKYKLNPNEGDFRVGLGLVSVKGNDLSGVSPIKDALINDNTFGMFLGRWDNPEKKTGIVDLMDWQEAPNSYGLQAVPEFDGARDIRYYRDISDKYMSQVASYFRGKFKNENGDWVDFVLDGKDNEPKMGNFYNDYLMITYSVEPKVTNVIFWIYRFSPKGMVENTSDASLGIHDVILKAVDRYMRYYSAIGALSAEKLQLLEKIIYSLTQPILPPEVIYFRKSVIPIQDNTLSDTAQENKYYKDNDVNKYVFRYSGDIVPAMFTPVPRAGGTGGTYTYENRLGRNFLWVKDYYDRNDRNSRYNRFAYTNLAPRYPSLSYDSVLLYTADGDGTINYVGPPPFVTSRPGGEYKWFSESSMKNLPTEITFTLSGENKDDRDTIIAHARNEAQSRLRAYGLPSSRVFELYNIEYEYLRMHKLSSGVLAADYKVIIKLK